MARTAAVRRSVKDDVDPQTVGSKIHRSPSVKREVEECSSAPIASSSIGAQKPEPKKRSGKSSNRYRQKLLARAMPR
ncbi:hypothetical protein PANT_7d00184 [Moesziomyces antarcticus T-34]|uniref:Uncharacterized protein n=1 Tax=Pseudozyma antarctica (strain T-34) TaxID=1151754 RepID=M9LM74_PSEA3|nr:hypothetical protein PANT_7d00184 [Moesziomyces antarcticus T-34]